MLGAILGDMVGSPYEFDRGDKIKDFGPLFGEDSCFTDDSVMTIAVAEALLSVPRDADGDVIKEATACAIYMARTGASKEEIKEFVVNEIGYDLSRTLDEIRPTYCHKESCQETVPEAITAFLEGNDFEDVIRNAVSLSGDCDTLTCIAGGIAEAFHGVPDEYRKQTLERMNQDMKKVFTNFEEEK